MTGSQSFEVGDPGGGERGIEEAVAQLERLTAALLTVHVLMADSGMAGMDRRLFGPSYGTLSVSPITGGHASPSERMSDTDHVFDPEVV